MFARRRRRDPCSSESRHALEGPWGGRGTVAVVVVTVSPTAGWLADRASAKPAPAAIASAASAPPTTRLRDTDQPYAAASSAVHAWSARVIPRSSSEPPSARDSIAAMNVAAPWARLDDNARSPNRSLVVARDRPLHGMAGAHAHPGVYRGQHTSETRQRPVSLQGLSQEALPWAVCGWIPQRQDSPQVQPRLRHDSSPSGGGGWQAV